MKLSLEDKKEIVRLYFDEHYGFRKLERSFLLVHQMLAKLLMDIKYVVKLI